MNVLLDQGVPVPLKDHLTEHSVRTAMECGWSTFKNGELLAVAEKHFDVVVTTDQNLRYQQNLSNRRIAIVVLLTTRWPLIRSQVDRVVQAVNAATAASYTEVTFTR
jgi:hypothetical protein